MLEKPSFSETGGDWAQGAWREWAEAPATLPSHLERLPERFSVGKKPFAPTLMRAETDAGVQRVEFRCDIEGLRRTVAHARALFNDPTTNKVGLHSTAVDHPPSVIVLDSSFPAGVPQKTLLPDRDGKASAAERWNSTDRGETKALDDLTVLVRQQGQQIDRLKEQVSRLEQTTDDHSKSGKSLALLDDSEARFTELHEHIMALHRRIEDQEQVLMQQDQLLQQHLDQIQRLESRLAE